MIVAIDGPAGSGKSTIAREIARRFGFFKLDTGAMYRAVTLSALNRGISLDDEQAVDDLARTISIVFPPSQGSSDVHVEVDGQDVSHDIRTPRIDANVSQVAAYPGVREAMLIPQRACANDRDIVAEGRDIGTVVFPKADIKVFLTANPHERARRRVIQRHEGENISEHDLAQEIEETYRAIKARDEADSHRDVAPLIAAPDAVRIDSTAYSIDEVVNKVGDLIRERRKA